MMTYSSNALGYNLQLAAQLDDRQICPITLATSLQSRVIICSKAILNDLHVVVIVTFVHKPVLIDRVISNLIDLSCSCYQHVRAIFETPYVAPKCS